MNQFTPFILASGSPRRRELLSMCGFTFTVQPVDADEELPKNIPPDEACVMLARRKAAAQKNAGSQLVVAADTIVFLDGQRFGKPASKAGAVQMLNRLSGRTHQVYTGVCLRQGRREDAFFDVTAVTFINLSPKEIEEYVDSGEPMDKAGGYGIQGRGALWVKGIVGDYYNVMGFPLCSFYRHLLQFEEELSTQ